MGLEVIYPTLALAQGVYRTQLSKQRLFVPTIDPPDVGTSVSVCLRIRETGGSATVTGQVLRLLDSAAAKEHKLGTSAGIVLNVPITEDLRTPLRELLIGKTTPPAASATTNSDDDDNNLGEVGAKLRGFLDGASDSDHYQALRIAPNASQDDVRSAYRKLMRLFHPDNYYGRIPEELRDGLETAYQRATMAYEVLVDPKKRDAYDVEIGNLGGTQGGSSAEVKRKRAQLEVYKAQNAVGIRKAKDLVQSALEDEQAGRLKEARNKLKLAQNFDPRNPIVARKLREIGS